MKRGGYIVSAITAATALPLHHGFTCKYQPTNTIEIDGTTFDAADYGGTWMMYQSTYYNKDRYGCITLEISREPDTAAKTFDARFSYVNTFDWNPLKFPFQYQQGQPSSERYSFTYDDTGKLTHHDLYFIPNTQQIMFVALKFMVVYDCSLYVPHILNMRADQIHIYVREYIAYDQEELEIAMEFIDNTLVSKWTDEWAALKDNLQELPMIHCPAKTVWSQLEALANEPEDYFSQW